METTSSSEAWPIYISVSNKHGGGWWSDDPPTFPFWAQVPPVKKGSSCAAPAEGPAFTHCSAATPGTVMRLGDSVTLTPDLHLTVTLWTVEITLSVAFSVFADTEVWEVREERWGEQKLVTTSSRFTGVAFADYTSQTWVWTEPFSQWINVEWPNFLHIIYYLCCCFIDFETSVT